MRAYFLIGFVLVFLAPSSASALQEMKRLASDQRFATYVYDPNDVYVFKGHYRFLTTIELSPTETINRIAVGDSTAWSISNEKNRIFLKPIDQDATTNMSVYTDKRIYHFELYADEAEDIRDENLIFSVRFTYPNTANSANSSFRSFADQDLPDIENQPEKFNFSYTTSGSKLIAPLKAFDDGEFTYIEFRDINGQIPAIYNVDKNGEESLINYRVMGPYIVIERVAKQFTLRDGSEAACLFNEKWKL